LYPLTVYRSSIYIGNVAGRALDDDELQKMLPLPEAAFHILVALADHDRHGYALMQEVADLTEGRMRLRPGTLYSAIHSMLAYRRETAEMANECDAAEGSDRRLVTRLALVGDVLLTAPPEHFRMLSQDLRHALRVLAASPALTVPVVLVLAIGIGATTGVFTI